MPGREGGGALLLENARGARRVRWLLFGSAAFCAGFLYWAIETLRTYGLSPGDGGALLPAGERQWWAALLAILGLSPFLAMVVYAGIYLARIELRAGRLLLSTVGLFATKIRDVDPAKVRAIHFHDWPLEPGSPISTRWLTLRIDGRRRPFIVDLGADHVDRRAIEKLWGEPVRGPV